MAGAINLEKPLSLTKMLLEIEFMTPSKRINIILILVLITKTVAIYVLQISYFNKDESLHCKSFICNRLCLMFKQ